MLFLYRLMMDGNNVRTNFPLQVMWGRVGSREAKVEYRLHLITDSRPLKSLICPDRHPRFDATKPPFGFVSLRSLPSRAGFALRAEAYLLILLTFFQPKLPYS